MTSRQIQFSFTENDMVNATSLSAARAIPFPIPLLLLGGAAVCGFAMFYEPMRASIAALYLAPVTLFVIILVALTLYIYLPWQARRQYRQSATFKDVITANWNDDRMKLSGEHGNIDLAWEDYHRWAEDREFLLLYHNDAAFNAIPKSALNDDQCDDIRSKLKQAGVRKKGR